MKTKTTRIKEIRSYYLKKIIKEKKTTAKDINIRQKRIRQLKRLSSKPTANKSGIKRLINNERKKISRIRQRKNRRIKKYRSIRDDRIARIRGVRPTTIKPVKPGRYYIQKVKIDKKIYYLKFRNLDEYNKILDKVLANYAHKNSRVEYMRMTSKDYKAFKFIAPEYKERFAKYENVKK